MKDALLDFLACPACEGDLSLDAGDREGDEVMSGSLTCAGCDARYAIAGGVPRMNTEMGQLENVARSFGYEWKAHHEGAMEDDTVFGRTLDEDWEYFRQGLAIGDDAVRDAVVLDGGCGSGRLTRQIGEHGAGAAIGVDINDAVDEAYALSRDLPNVHIVQANIFALPFKKRAFDLVWSNGVIHHTPDAERGHRSLSALVKPGGRLYVWVYAKRFNPFRLVKDGFDAVRLSRLPEPVLLRIAKVISYPSWLLLQAYRAVRRIPPLRPRGRWAQNTVRQRSLPEFQLTWLDALSPEYDSRHTEAEVKDWFRSQGFVQVEAIEEPKVGVRGTAPASP
jgi:SAM-dependent methyltransferase